METAFPRGRGAPSRSSTETSKLNKPSEESNQDQSRQRRDASSERKKKKRSSSGGAASDFLFGGSQKSSENLELVKRRKTAAATTASKSVNILPLGGGGVVHPTNSKGEAYIEALSFSKLNKGMKLLAVVREIHADLVVFSLPNLWSGYMLRSGGRNSNKADRRSRDKSGEEGMPCTSMLSVGQYLSVVIVKAVQETTATGPRRRIQVNCRPSAVNSSSTTSKVARGQVLSVEDHGLLVDLGFGRRGFLSFDDIEGDYTVDEDEDMDDGEQIKDHEEEEENTSPNNGQGRRILTPGRIDDFVIKGKSSEIRQNGGVISLRLPSQEDMASDILSSTPKSLDSLQPGTLVHSKVEGFVRNGLCVTFGNGVFRGAIEVQHLGGYWIPDSKQESSKWKGIFESRLLTARILAVDAASKIIRLSLQPHLINLRHGRFRPSLVVGSVLDKATVIRMDPGVGALLALPTRLPEDVVKTKVNSTLWKQKEYRDAACIQTVYVHISKAMDESQQQDGKTPESAFAKQFAPSTQHPVRILSTSNWIDGISSGSTASNVISALVLSHGDLIPGKVYRQVPVCAHVRGGGILVDFGMGVRGLIPSNQLFDQTTGTSEYRTKMRNVKYALQAKVDVRVLSVDSDEKRCLLTAKRSLVKAKHIFASFEEARVGQRATGFVSKIDDTGLSVTFLNGVYGRVTARSLSTELGVENISENYQVGDVVDCRVTNIKKRIKKQHNAYDDDDMQDGDEEEEHLHCYWELTLSLSLKSDPDGQSAALDPDASERRLTIRAGAILPARSLRIVKLFSGKEKKSGFVPGYAIVSVKSKYLLGSKDIRNAPEYIECKLPYDQILDQYSEEDIHSPESLDTLAETLLVVGKKVDRKGLVMTDPEKSTAEFASGTGKLTVVSIRPQLIEAVESQQSSKGSAGNTDVCVPDLSSHLFVGEKLLGYVAQIDKRYGAFVRFLNGLTGLVPKRSGGLILPLFSTVKCSIVEVDLNARPTKILLSCSETGLDKKTAKRKSEVTIERGDKVNEAEVKDVNFHRAILSIQDEKWKTSQIRARLHFSLARSKILKGPLAAPRYFGNDEPQVTEFHPFYGVDVGSSLTNLTVANVDKKDGHIFVDLTNMPLDLAENTAEDEDVFDPTRIDDVAELATGKRVTGIASAFDEKKGGLWMSLNPSTSAFMPALELSDDERILNDLPRYFPLGSRLSCVVMDGNSFLTTRSKALSSRPRQKNQGICLVSLLQSREKPVDLRPKQGDLVIGRVNRKLRITSPPALMLELRGGYIGRCCITELAEQDEWTNMPLGSFTESKPSENSGSEPDDVAAKSTHRKSFRLAEVSSDQAFVHGLYLRCRVIGDSTYNQNIVDVSLRPSRLEGDLEDDALPETGDLVHAFVVDTNKKGCFLRLSRGVDGRAVLKELSDGFLSDPVSSFPMGRLVVGRVKNVITPRSSSNSKLIDLDMRESSIISPSNKLTFEDVAVGQKFKGEVTRIEAYGVFVRLENSDLSGLVHKSECSDQFIRDLTGMYDPGDLVKILVIKRDEDKKELGFSMKASHFQDDDDSDDSEESEDMSVDGVDVENHETTIDEQRDVISGDGLDSDDDNIVSKLASRMGAHTDGHADHSEGNSDSSSSSGSDSESESSEDEETSPPGANSFRDKVDTDVGFDWDGKILSNDHDASGTSDSEEDTSSDDEDNENRKSNKSRQKQAQRLREEQEISRRENALADGTADENPETAADFERLLAGNPDSSELWIKYMAFHLLLADIPAARDVAERAFDRISFRQEGERLNVWCALMTLELKYGTDESLQKTIDRACKHNNPKHVYLRICEILAKQSRDSPHVPLNRTDEMYLKMCKKFKGKKKAWLAYIEYLLKSARHEEAHDIAKRALKSLPAYKHVETMKKVAQLEFEYGSHDRARTLFDGLLLKNPKRLDVFFVYVDKEVKHGDVDSARLLFQKQSGKSGATKMKLSDKQMKSFFKKWFAFEEKHGTMNDQEAVKDAARSYVERASS